LCSGSEDAQEQNAEANLTRSLQENFQGPEIDPRLLWQSEPTRWELDASAGCLRLWSDAGTDFWQRTHYGFRADNGHLLYKMVEGDALIQTRLRLMPQNQYDQAGLMIWISPSCWIKTSVEFEPHGKNQLGAVVTNGGYSDWSTQPIDRALTDFWFRVKLERRDIVVHGSLNGQDWHQLRVSTLLERNQNEPVRCGLYACSPKGAGFCVEFDHLFVGTGKSS